MKTLAKIIFSIFILGIIIIAVLDIPVSSQSSEIITLNQMDES